MYFYFYFSFYIFHIFRSYNVSVILFQVCPLMSIITLTVLFVFSFGDNSCLLYISLIVGTVDLGIPPSP